MRKEEYQLEKMNYTRVSKKVAEKAYNAGKTVVFAPVNVNLDSPWHNWSYQNKTQNNFDFSQLVNEYEYYNCQYNELGKYAKFFVRGE